MSADNDDDVAGGAVEGTTFVLDCNDNVVISETGVVAVVTASKRERGRKGEKKKRMRNEMKMRAE
jgi:hypothetical protein